MPDLPGGTVTFLMTDVEGSTAAWEADEAAMRGAIARLDLEMERTVDAHGGVLVKARGEGDSHFCVFDRAADAVAAALAIQLAMSELPLSLRMAVHSGAAELRDADYYGPTVNRCARLRAVGHGGQVLLSEATTALVRDQLPTDASLIELGTHRLRDLTRPEEVAQLAHPALRADFSPLRSLDVVRHNLPVQLTSFVGRDAELAEVAAVLRAHRLVTVAGPGGAGKTRLALQLAADLLDEFPDGVWFVDLASVTDPTAVAGAVSRALGLGDQAGREPIEILGDRLRPETTLLILDNCEQALDGVAPLALTLVDRAPGLRLLATTREPIGVAGEAVWRIPALSCPDLAALGPIESLSQFEAVRLFIERAVTARASFEITNANAPAVAEICHRLGGIPLALELAAARVRMMTPDQIQARLGDVFGLLTGGARATVARQQTLRAAIAWSHDLLSTEEQVLFRRLGIFVGAPDLDAIEAVSTDGAPALDLLDALVGKSLVSLDEVNGDGQYRILETVRTFARDRLAEAGETNDFAARHASWARGLVAGCQRLKGSLEEAGQFDRLERHHVDLLAALEHLGATDDGADLELAADLGRFWTVRGYWRLARERLTFALARDKPRNAVGVRCDSALGDVAIRLGDYPEARARHEEALAIARELGDRQRECDGVVSLGHVALYLGDYPEARARYGEALAIARELGARQSEGEGVGSLGDVSFHLGDYPEARARYEEALAIARELGVRQSEGAWVGGLGLVALRLGDYPEARARLDDSRAIARELGDRQGEGAWVGSLGHVSFRLGDYPEARARYGEALADARELGDRQSEGVWVGGLGHVARYLGDYPEARARYGEALAIARELGARQLEGVLVGSLGDVAFRLGDYPEARARHEEALAIVRELGDRHSEGVLVGSLGDVAFRLGDYPEARARYAEALVIAAALAVPESTVGLAEGVGHLLASVDRETLAAPLCGFAATSRVTARDPWAEQRFQQTVDALRQQLGEERFRAGWDEGAALGQAAAIELMQEALRDL